VKTEEALLRFLELPSDSSVFPTGWCVVAAIHAQATLFAEFATKHVTDQCQFRLNHK
jgi:hypothetical protein